jgi:hypothetical protein
MPGASQQSPPLAPIQGSAMAAESPASAAVRPVAIVPEAPASAPAEENRAVSAHVPAAASRVPPPRPIASSGLPTPTPTPAQLPTRPAPAAVPAVGLSAPSTAARAPAVAPCADLNLFARASCLSRVCETPQWKSHPQCVEARGIAEQRQRRMDQ